MPKPEEEGSRAVDDPGRQESEAERVDRNVAELLQELRVAGLGVQVLFGFLLALPFSARFDRLDGAQRNLYLATILLAALGDRPAHRPGRLSPVGVPPAPEERAPSGGQRDGPPWSRRRRARHLGGRPSRRRCRRARRGGAGRRRHHRGGVRRALVRVPAGPSAASRRGRVTSGSGPRRLRHENGAEARLIRRRPDGLDVGQRHGTHADRQVAGVDLFHQRGQLGHVAPG